MGKIQPAASLHLSPRELLHSVCNLQKVPCGFKALKCLQRACCIWITAVWGLGEIFSVGGNPGSRFVVLLSVRTF